MVEVDNTEIDIDEIIAEIIAEREEKQTRRENPYVLMLITALRPSPAGRRRPEVIRLLEAERQRLKMPKIDKFEEAVQASYNRHSEDSSVFQKKKNRTRSLYFFQ